MGSNYESQRVVRPIGEPLYQGWRNITITPSSDPFDENNTYHTEYRASVAVLRTGLSQVDAYTDEIERQSKLKKLERDLYLARCEYISETQPGLLNSGAVRQQIMNAGKPVRVVEGFQPNNIHSIIRKFTK